MKKAAISMVCILLYVGLLVRPCYGDGSRIFKSVVFPGMGQLGDDQVLKGLAFMGAEVVLLTLTAQETSKWIAYVRETEYSSVRYTLDSTYALKLKTHQKWQKAYDNAGKSATMALVYGAAAALCWGLNVVDAALFPPVEKRGSERMQDDIRAPALQRVPAPESPAKQQNEEKAGSTDNTSETEESQLQSAPQEPQQPSPSQQTPEGESFLRKIHDNTVITIGPGRSSVSYIFNF